MLRLVSDENFNGDIFRGLVRRHPELELARVQGVGRVQIADIAFRPHAFGGLAGQQDIALGRRRLNRHVEQQWNQIQVIVVAAVRHQN
jgi:hypothetical protein